MNKKYIFVLIIVALGFFYFSNQQQPIGEQVINKKEEQTVVSNSIILKIPIIEYKVPGNVLSDPAVKGYTNKTVQRGSEFVIEPSTLEYLLSGQVGDIKLKLIEIKNNSVVVDVLADKQFDKNFYPRKTIERKEILNNSCISAFPLVTDVYYEFCFDVGNEMGKS
ncbi:MAG: hypothetical protein ABIF89_02595 [bacterium]